MKSLLFIIGFFITHYLEAQIITTYAGNGISGFSGDGGNALLAKLSIPQSVCSDNLGNIYIADRNNAVVRKVNSLGIITTFAGTGIIGYTGDGGLATNAKIGIPSDVCIDNLGNLFISDFGWNVIRKVDTLGIITTVAGTGVTGYSGDGGLAINALLFGPTGICVDNNNNLYIAEYQYKIIRKVSSSGIISTFAGVPSSPGYAGGYSGDGDLATNAQLSRPTDVSADASGNIYIADQGNSAIRKVNLAGIISTFAGGNGIGYSGNGGVAIAAKLNIPFFVFSSNDSLYISDSGNGAIRLVDNNNIITTIAGNGILGYSGDGGLATLAKLNYPSGMCKDNLGNIFIADNSNYVIRKICLSTPSIILQPLNSNSCNAGNSTFSIISQNAINLQWQVNNGTGWNDILNNIMYTGAYTNILNVSNVSSSMNSYQYRCKVNNACGIIYSNTALLSVNIPTTPSISITASSNSICSGTNVNFIAISTSGGSSPSFQWKKNGLNVGTNVASYIDNSLNNLDVISCVLTSNQSCNSVQNITSNSIVMSVTASIVPSISINSFTLSICEGSTITFNATLINSGLNPSYQWQKNGTNVGNNSNSYSASNLLDGDSVGCTVTTSGNCFNPAFSNSNLLTVRVFQNPTVILDKTQTLCIGTNKVLKPGNFSSYLWNDNSIADSLIINSLGTYYVTVTDNNGCKRTDTSKINSILPLPTNFLSDDTTICSYGTLSISSTKNFSQYLWNNNSTQKSLTINQAGLYWLQVKDNNNCMGRDTIKILPKQCAKGFYIPTAFTPNGDSKNDIFKPLFFGILKKFNFSIFNRFGQIVFRSSDINNGWDGKFRGQKSGGNVFVWICNYQFENELEVNKNGTVLLIK